MCHITCVQRCLHFTFCPRAFTELFWKNITRNHLCFEKLKHFFSCFAKIVYNNEFENNKQYNMGILCLFHLAAAVSSGISSWRWFLGLTCHIIIAVHYFSGLTTCSASSASQVNCIWLYAHLHVPLHLQKHTSEWDRSGPGLPRLWCPAWCCFLQEEGEQRRSKTGHLQICQGSSPALLLSALRGKSTKGRTLSLLLSPLFWPRPALPSLGRVLPSSTPLFLCESGSGADGGHLVWCRILTATTDKLQLHITLQYLLV